jgi:hypothetical protein
MKLKALTTILMVSYCTSSFSAPHIFADDEHMYNYDVNEEDDISSYSLETKESKDVEQKYIANPYHLHFFVTNKTHGSNTKNISFNGKEIPNDYGVRFYYYGDKGTLSGLKTGKSTNYHSGRIGSDGIMKNHALSFSSFASVKYKTKKDPNTGYDLWVDGHPDWEVDDNGNRIIVHNNKVPSGFATIGGTSKIDVTVKRDKKNGVKVIFNPFTQKEYSMYDVSKNKYVWKDPNNYFVVWCPNSQGLSTKHVIKNKSLTCNASENYYYEIEVYGSGPGYDENDNYIRDF